MDIKDIRTITLQSNNMLELARQYADDAVNLPDGDAKRAWLEEEAARLIAEARTLTGEAKRQLSRAR